MSEPDCDEVLHPKLSRAVEALRGDVEVRGPWRDALLREVEKLPAPLAGGVIALPQRRERRWSMSPVAAIAAGLALLALGAAGAGVAMRIASSSEGTVAREEVSVAAPPVTAVATSDERSVAGASTVRFMLVASSASRVSVVGDFNRWDPNATPMRRLNDGRTWVAELPLAAGRHVYAFVVDGGLTTDPAAPRAAEDDFGVPSSVLMVPRRAS